MDLFSEFHISFFFAEIFLPRDLFDAMSSQRVAFDFMTNSIWIVSGEVIVPPIIVRYFSIFSASCVRDDCTWEPHFER